MSVTKSLFGTMPDGKEIYRFTIENNNNVQASILTLGATLHSIVVPDKNNVYEDILLGFDDVEGYIERSSYQGAVVGPYANRIGNGTFTIDGIKYDLVKNEKQITCLHSGGEFSFAVWDSIIIDSDAVEFSYISTDGTNGFPGTLKVSVVYRLGENNDLHISYKATTDKKTFINLTNHAYFNLSGCNGDTILNHVLQMPCSYFTPVDALSITNGTIDPVDNTPFDFRTPKAIGKDIEEDNQQLHLTGGFDHNFVIDNADGSIRKCAYALDPVSNRELHVYTDLPGVQFYAGNFLEGEIGKNGRPMPKRSGFCLETQYYPDTPNKPSFPQCLFDKNETFTSETIFIFSVKED